MNVARDQWVRSLRAWKPAPPERIYKLTLQSLARVMTPDGVISRPRGILLEASGLSSKRSLERHLAYAVEHGWLLHVRRGVQRSACARYEATVPPADHPPSAATDDLSTIRRTRRQVREDNGRFGTGKTTPRPPRPSAADVRVVDARPSAVRVALIETFANNPSPGVASTGRFIFPPSSQRGHVLGVWLRHENRSPRKHADPVPDSGPVLAGLGFDLALDRTLRGARMEANDPIPTLCRLLAEMRPGWSTEDVKAALYEPSVWRRPFGVVAAAAVLCAADPETEGPGRLRTPGPWWSRAGATPTPPPVAVVALSEAQRAAYAETARRGAAACREALAQREKGGE